MLKCNKFVFKKKSFKYFLAICDVSITTKGAANAILKHVGGGVTV